MATAAVPVAPVLPAGAPLSHALQQQQQHSSDQVEAYARELAAIIEADATGGGDRANASAADSPVHAANVARRLRRALPGILDVCVSDAAGSTREITKQKRERERERERERKREKAIRIKTLKTNRRRQRRRSLSRPRPPPKKTPPHIKQSAPASSTPPSRSSRSSCPCTRTRSAAPPLEAPPPPLLLLPLRR